VTQPPGATGPHLPEGPYLTAQELRRWDSERPLEGWSQCHDRYGPIFTLHAEGASDRVFVSDPAALHELFVANRAVWGSRGSQYFKPVIGAQSLPYISGERHREVRRMLMRALHGKPVRALAPDIAGIVAAALDGLRGRTTPLIEFTHDITLRVIVRVAFGALEPERAEQCVAVLTEIMHLMYEPEGTPHTDQGDSTRRLDHLIGEVQDIVTAEAATARSAQSIPRDDLLFHLAANLPAEADHQIRGHIMSLLIAGHDTTANALAWAIIQLDRDPAIRKRLTAETTDDNPYLAAVCAETLRHGSVVPLGIARIVPEQLNWSDFRIPAGTELVANIHRVHHRDDLYPDPEEFRPERFLGRKPPGTHYLPFGTGTRRCPGAELAEFELATTLPPIVATPGLRLSGAGPEVRTVKNGPTMAVPRSVLVTVITPELPKAGPS